MSDLPSGPWPSEVVRRCIDAVLDAGLDDWVMAAEVASIARDVTGAATVAEVRSLCLEVIAQILRERLGDVGSVVQGRGFVGWGASTDVAMERIAAEWKGEGPGLGEVCWLSNTEAGDERARGSAG